tara:strand:+ start:12370 stop:12732 length:363 start_codon:yes stop_codon:yes gene_type:complete
MLFVVGNVCSQNQGTITGTVSDIELDNEPLLFANVQLKNTSKIAQTNFHGNFEFTNVASGDYILVFSFLGYDTIEVPVVVKNNEITRANGELKTKVITLATIANSDIAEAAKPKNSISLK